MALPAREDGRADDRHEDAGPAARAGSSTCAPRCSARRSPTCGRSARGCDGRRIRSATCGDRRSRRGPRGRLRRDPNASPAAPPRPRSRHLEQVVPMKVGVAKETAPGERRVALVPEALGKLQAAGLEILVEAGAGAGSAIPDSAFAEAGATIVPTDALYQQSDVVLRVAKPDADGGRPTAHGPGGRRVPRAAHRPGAGEGPRRERASPPSASTRSRGPCRGRSRWTRSAARRTSAATRPCSSPPTRTAATSRC